MEMGDLQRKHPIIELIINEMAKSGEKYGGKKLTQTTTVARRLITFFVLGGSRLFAAGSAFFRFSAGSVRAGWFPLLAPVARLPAPSGSCGFEAAGSGAIGGCFGDSGRSIIGVARAPVAAAAAT
jgi:hypothetical protein